MYIHIGGLLIKMCLSLTKGNLYFNVLYNSSVYLKDK